MNSDQWPPLPLSDWQDTYRTLHMWTQIVGKIRMTLSPPMNHWWHVALYVNSHGLTLDRCRIRWAFSKFNSTFESIT